MRKLLTVLIVLAAGIAGLGLVFTDLGPGDTEAARLWTGGVFYFLAGSLVGWLNGGRSGRRWAAATAWGMILLGVVGVWISLTDPASADLRLALLFLLGPLGAALLGGALGAALADRGGTA